MRFLFLTQVNVFDPDGLGMTKSTFREMVPEGHHSSLFAIDNVWERYIFHLVVFFSLCCSLKKLWWLAINALEYLIHSDCRYIAFFVRIDPEWLNPTFSC